MKVLRPALPTALLALLLATLPGESSAQATPKPNLLFILADDLGISDLGCYGHPFFETPHLDRLASEGCRFTQAYAPAPICSASRAAILTGKTPARLGFEFVTKDQPGHQSVPAPLRAPAFTLDLPLDEQTLPEILGEAGYRTGFAGKWHLNRHHQRYLGWSPTHGPASQGFEWTADGFGSHPYGYWKDRKARETFLELPEGRLPPDSLTESAIRFLEERDQRPFFLMVSHYYVHDPIHTQARWLHDDFLERIPADHPRRGVLAHYGAMIATLDRLVGDLLAALEANDLADSTLVVFTADNGGHPNYAGNAPYRGSKWNLYEGGIRVPFLARWPGKLAPGSTSSTPISGIDLLPTLAGIAEGKRPPDLDGRPIPELRPDPPRDAPDRDLVWHFPYYHPEKKFAESPTAIGIDDGVTSQTRPHSAIRSGDWKLLHFYETGRSELYDLSTDPTESRDLAAERPETTAELHRKLISELRTMSARFPAPNPDWKAP